MKVALLNDQLNAGGAEKVLVNMANMMHERGVEVMVVLFMSRAALDRQLHREIPVFYLHREGRFDMRALRHLKQLVQYCDIVHVHSRYNLRYFMMAKYLMGIYKPKVVFHEHVPAYTKIDKMTRLLLTRVDAYVAVLNEICTWAKRSLLHASKVFYLPNIVAAPAEEIHINVLPGRILMTGNFRRVKNHLFAIQVLQALPEYFTLDLLGMVEEQEYYYELNNYVQDNKLTHRVRFVKGINNLYSQLSKYHFALHTATLETGPLVLLEYMHAGLPFLTYNTGDVAANIGDTLPQVVLNEFDVDRWVNRIRGIMSNDEHRKEVTEKMRHLIEELYTEEKYWQRLSDIYHQVLSKAAKRLA